MIDSYYIPRHWMNYESDAAIRPVMENYVAGERLGADQIPVMKKYLTDWISGEDLTGSSVESLRLHVGQIQTQEDVDRWIEWANAAVLCPL
jgi:hypothetical protein